MIAAFALPRSAWIAAALVPLTFIALVWIGRWLKRRQHVRIGVIYLLFSIALSLYLPLQFLGPMMVAESPAIQPQPAISGDQAEISRQLAELETQLKATREQLATGASASARESLRVTTRDLTRHLGAGVLLLGTLFGLALIRRYFWELWFERQHKTPAPKFLSQIFGLIIFVSAILLVVSLIYGKDLTALVFGSTVVVGIVGFAMQDLLGNIIAGIALEFGKPFRIGDWLMFEHQHAEVIEVNWRSTKLRTNDDVYLDIPNKTIVGTTITNLTYPTRQHALRVKIGFDYNVPPNFVKDCLGRAAAHATGVLTTPAPKVYLRDFGDSAVIYEIKFWLDNAAIFNDVLDAIRTNVWYEAQRNKIRIPFPIRTLQIERPQARHEDALEAAREAMRKQQLLQCLDDAQATRLLMNAKLLRFGRGEKIIEQGQSGESMFILVEGEADVFVKANGPEMKVATLKPGDYFGEMSLLTGEPRSATVCARTDCQLCELEKPVLAEILQENQDLVNRLCERLAERRLETEGVLAATTGKSEMSARQREYREGFLRRLYSFFEL